jgi:hypothetical protein
MVNGKDKTLSKSARIGSLILFCVLLFADDANLTVKDLPSVVFIEFELTVVNKDNGTTKTKPINQEFDPNEWQKKYRPFTQDELKTLKKFKGIRLGQVKIIVQTI